MFLYFFIFIFVYNCLFFLFFIYYIYIFFLFFLFMCCCLSLFKLIFYFLKIFFLLFFVSGAGSRGKAAGGGDGLFPAESALCVVPGPDYFCERVF